MFGNTGSAMAPRRASARNATRCNGGCPIHSATTSPARTPRSCSRREALLQSASIWRYVTTPPLAMNAARDGYRATDSRMRSTRSAMPYATQMPTRKAALAANPDLMMDLVAANRILAFQGVLDSYGHVSVRSDRKPGHFYMSRSLAPELVVVADVMEHGADSEPIGDDRKPYLERFLHGEIYRSRPDVTAIVHSHAESVIPFGITKGKLRPVYHMASFLWSGAPVFEIRRERAENDLLIRDRSLGESLAKSLGSCTCVLMRGHGMTVVGASLPE